MLAGVVAKSTTIARHEQERSEFRRTCAGGGRGSPQWRARARRFRRSPPSGRTRGWAVHGPALRGRGCAHRVGRSARLPLRAVGRLDDRRRAGRKRDAAHQPRLRTQCRDWRSRPTTLPAISSSAAEACQDNRRQVSNQESLTGHRRRDARDDACGSPSHRQRICWRRLPRTRRTRSTGLSTDLSTAAVDNLSSSAGLRAMSSNSSENRRPYLTSWPRRCLRLGTLRAASLRCGRASIEQTGSGRSGPARTP
jgi:hypothetical protein